jgi:hypothetical protein
VAMLAELDKRLQYGPGMRVQRLVEAAFLIATFFTNDLWFAYVTLGLTLLQVLSPRLVPVALLVSACLQSPKEHHLSDLYFDLAGTRGACALAAVVQVVAVSLVRSGHEVIGYVLLTMPTASFLLAPTVGFCSGCAVYVFMRDLLARVGVVERYAHGACDIDIDGSKTSRPQ